ncbi:flagellar hook-length control protein FliK [Paraferrimonas sp. SM1919]|uniref:flagellar hook-length control protein FliK n=1 Tax=Paraferrimonas sp. SM1919 TaxID=2662263 RepID=UPI0013D48C1E|nr:flagellar hook-length control protein FliK [Paraferrimonas sp. SM1919]
MSVSLDNVDMLAPLFDAASVDLDPQTQVNFSELLANVSDAIETDPIQLQGQQQLLASAATEPKSDTLAINQRHTDFSEVDTQQLLQQIEYSNVLSGKQLPFEDQPLPEAESLEFSSEHSLSRSEYKLQQPQVLENDVTLEAQSPVTLALLPDEQPEPQSLDMERADLISASSIEGIQLQPTQSLQNGHVAIEKAPLDVALRADLVVSDGVKLAPEFTPEGKQFVSIATNKYEQQLVKSDALDVMVKQAEGESRSAKSAIINENVSVKTSALDGLAMTSKLSQLPQQPIEEVKVAANPPISTSTLSSLNSNNMIQASAQIGADAVSSSLPLKEAAANSMIGNQLVQQRLLETTQNQIKLMIQQATNQAEIKLDPPELGSMVIRLQVQGDQTQVQFQVQHQHTKELLEQSLERLKGMLEQQGLSLADTHVGRDQGSDEGRTFAQHGSDEVTQTDEITANTSTAIGKLGLIDYYA